MGQANFVLKNFNKTKNNRLRMGCVKAVCEKIKHIIVLTKLSKCGKILYGEMLYVGRYYIKITVFCADS